MQWLTQSLLLAVVTLSYAQDCVDHYPEYQCLQIKPMCTSTFSSMARDMCKKTCGQCGPIVQCQAGYRNYNGKCVDIDECAEGKVQCQVNARCQNTEGAYACVCAEGYVGKPLTGCFKKIPCMDSIGPEECVEKLEKTPSACYQNTLYMTQNCRATCKMCATAQDDGSCPVGYTFNAGICLDANECLQTYNGGCPVGSMCQNLYGSHTCNCPRGYSSALTADGRPTCISEAGRLCRANGDPHFFTFDGEKINFQGTCEYTLAKVCDQKQGDQNAFEVIVKNEHRYGNMRVSYIQYIKIKVFGLTLELHKGKLFMVNGVKKSLPWSPRLDIKVAMSMDGVEVKTNFGLKVIYDGNMRAYVTVPEQYRGEMCGICGNFDSDAANDLATANGTIVKDNAVGHAQIGNSYQVSGQTGVCENALPYDPVESCDATKRAEAEAKCALLLDQEGPFKPCHASGTFAPKQYYDACVEDMCANSENYCLYLENFVDDCTKDTGLDMFVWRTPEFCPKHCGPNSHYNPMMPSDPNTCAAPNAAADAASSMEGCECNHGFVMSGTECVATESCGCLLEGQYFELGEKWTDETCSTTYECLQGNRIVKQRIECLTSTEAECKVVDGKQGCYCREGLTVNARCGVIIGDPGIDPGDGTDPNQSTPKAIEETEPVTQPPLPTDIPETTTKKLPEGPPPEPSVDETDEEDKYFQLIPLPHPKPKPEPLGVASGMIPVSAITASSFDPSSSADSARPSTPGAWIPSATDTNRPYLQIDLGEAILIHGLGTLGHPAVACWVQKYTVEVSVDGVTFKPLLDTVKPVTRIFIGNKDQNTWKRYCLHRDYGEPVNARIIRFYPLESYTKICMRFELYGFHDPESPVFIDFITNQDVWTNKTTGCPCHFNPADMTCACCEQGGCQCPSSHRSQCVQCGYPFMCGIPTTDATQVDGWTRTPSGCPCWDDPAKDCACCMPYACQCGTARTDQCVNCGHPEHCGPWPVLPWGVCAPRTCP